MKDVLDKVNDKVSSIVMKPSKIRLLEKSKTAQTLLKPFSLTIRFQKPGKAKKRL